MFNDAPLSDTFHVEQFIDAWIMFPTRIADALHGFPVRRGKSSPVASRPLTIQCIQPGAILDRIIRRAI